MFKREKKPNAVEIYNKELERILETHNQTIKLTKPMKLLCERFTNEIYSVDMFMPGVTLINDAEILDDFLSYCRLVGLRVREVKSHTFYKSNTTDFISEMFYISIEFYNELDEDIELCD